MKSYLLLLPLLLTGCHLFFTVLEYDQVGKPSVTLHADEAGPYLKISGENFYHSAMIVEKVSQIKEGRIIALEVYMSPFNRDGHRNDFDTKVYLDDCDFVVFGSQRTLLWRRHPGTTPYKPEKPVFVPDEDMENIEKESAAAIL